MSSDTASSAGSQEGQENQRGGHEICSKVLNVDKRRFYIDLKENDRGKFIQIVALLNVRRKAKLMMTLPIVKQLIALLDKLEINESTEYPKPVGRILSASRIYFADLRKNDWGNFLRLTQAFNRTAKRYQIYIPVEGIPEFKKLLQEIVDEYGADVEEPKLPASQQLRDVRNKMFYFDCNSNDFGDYLRITETRFNSDNRTSITISRKNLQRFHDILGDLVKSFNELRTDEKDVKTEATA
ncbi:unnamed protein product [Bursaphelenchus xylophilus]|uniref:(pine wood nematode) hypothetical protein n=1 Tax=Bursaphelenchus xylophilus TaxID=6326 RepID=A0A1I7RHP7_BURXY|nr:unnamed protein product [Bursaphelenchus xylophilus]CAG9115514.1 unnamed protein product [Bursaphelenchus xylophilus]